MTLRSGWRATLAPWSVLALAVAVVSVISTRNPYQPGHYPSCPFLLLTGWHCPGCGSLRAVYSLGHAQFGDVFARNPLFPLGLVILAFIWASWLRRKYTGKPRSWAAPPQLIWLFLGIVLLFWVLRNIPGWEFLAP